MNKENERKRRMDGGKLVTEDVQFSMEEERAAVNRVKMNKLRRCGDASERGQWTF